MTVVTRTGRLSPLAVLALLAGPLLSMVDSNVVNVAIPDITRELHGRLADVQWAVSGYLLALAATLPATSWLAKRFGAVPAYAASLAAFVVASAACAFAGSVWQLVAFRVAQGVAAAPLVPLAMNLVFGGARQPGARTPMPGGRSVPAAAGIALFLGPAIGPTVGGLLVAAWSWPAIFLVNVPIGVAALAAVPSLRRQGIVSHPDPGARLDPVGLAMLSGGMVAVLYGASRGTSHGWWSPTVWPLWSVGAVLLAGYVLWARRRAHPAIDLRVVQRGQSVLAVWLCMLASVALFAVLFLLPVVIQDIQGHGPLASGLVLLPQGLVMGLSTQLGQWMAERGRLRLSILLGLGSVAVTTALLLAVDLSTPLWTTAAILAGRGVGLGLVVQPLLLVLLGGLSPAQVADANTLFSVAQRLGGSVGVSVLATFFTLRVTVHGAGGPAAALAGFHETVAVAVAVALVGLAFGLAVRSSPVATPAASPAR
jgi:EmrB/QacA subfamily drug resistance transporter